MRAHSITTWSVPTSLLGIVAGGVLLWLGFAAPGYDQPLPLAMAGGMVLPVGALVLLVFSARDRVSHDAADRKMRKYGCSACGHQTHLDDIEGGESYPCPRCGQPIYE